MTTEIGTGSDEVRVIIDGAQSFIVEAYQTSQGILTQPSAFCATLGHGDSIKALLATIPPGTPFDLLVGGRRQFSGRIDGYTASISASGSKVDIRGRDALAPIHDAYIESEFSVEGLSYLDLTKEVIRRALREQPFTLLTDNAANRRQLTGTKTTAKTKVSAMLGKTKTVHTKIGDRFFDGVLKPELDRAGLFLWADADGNFILSAPNSAQGPLYRITREARGSEIISTTFANDTTRRFSHCTVCGRRGGGEESRTKLQATYVDAEIAALGIRRPLCITDDAVKTIEQAEYLARRKIAESRRESWKLEYTVAGHTTQALDGSGPIVWAPDTVVDVQDSEIGVYGSAYIESVTRARGPEATTTLRLMRPEDLVFAEEEDGPAFSFGGVQLPATTAESKLMAGLTAGFVGGGRSIYLL